MTSQQRMFPARQWYTRSGYVPHTYGQLQDGYVQCAVCQLWLDAVRWFASCPGRP